MTREQPETLQLRQSGRGTFAAAFAGIDYKATDNTAFMGALIFALKPQLVLTDSKPCTVTFQLMATVALAHLRKHVKGKTIPDDVVEEWRWGAINLAPDARSAAETMWAFDHAVKHKQYALDY